MCICSPGVVELVISNLAPDFPLFHAVTPMRALTNTGDVVQVRLDVQHAPEIEQEETFIHSRDGEEVRILNTGLSLVSTLNTEL